MHNLSPTIIGQLHGSDSGYVQAVANAAHLVVSRIDDMFTQMLNGDTERLDKYMEVVLSDDELFASLMNPDIQVLDHLAQEIVPVISETYKVEVEDVTADIMVLTDYYSTASLLDNI